MTVELKRDDVEQITISWNFHKDSLSEVSGTLNKLETNTIIRTSFQADDGTMTIVGERNRYAGIQEPPR